MNSIDFKWFFGVRKANILCLKHTCFDKQKAGAYHKKNEQNYCHIVDKTPMHIQKTVERLGYKPNEVKAYLASLELGEATISEIAEKASLPRTSVQLIVQDLYEKHLLYTYVRKRRKYWIAENPERLMMNLKEKEASLKEILPELHAIRHETGVKPAIRSYTGTEGIWNILNDILGAKKNIRSLSSIHDIELLLGDEFRSFIQQRRHNNTRVELLTVRSPETEKLKNRDTKELRETRFLPKDIVIHNANFIYGEKVAIISLNKKLPVGMIIEDKDIAATQAMLFETLWEQSVN